MAQSTEEEPRLLLGTPAVQSLPLLPSMHGDAPLEAGGMMQSLRVYPTFRLLILGTLATNTAFWMYQVAVRQDLQETTS